MANTAESLVRRYRTSREAQDEFALRSHKRIVAAGPIEGYTATSDLLSGVLARSILGEELVTRGHDVVSFIFRVYHLESRLQ